MSDEAGTTADEAAERRRARKAARASAHAPERDLAFDHLSLSDLRQIRHELTEEETRVSYWRRIVQARIDVLQAGGEADLLQELARVLADAPSSSRRLAHVTVEAVDDVPPLPDLASLWARTVDPSDREATASLVEDLRDAERRMSHLRTELHRRIDAITGELIARFHENPALALAALPQR